jgi:hypothetical protein
MQRAGWGSTSLPVSIPGSLPDRRCAMQRLPIGRSRLQQQRPHPCRAVPPGLGRNPLPERPRLGGVMLRGRTNLALAHADPTAPLAPLRTLCLDHVDPATHVIRGTRRHSVVHTQEPEFILDLHDISTCIGDDSPRRLREGSPAGADRRPRLRQRVAAVMSHQARYPGVASSLSYSSSTDSGPSTAPIARERSRCQECESSHGPDAVRPRAREWPYRLRRSCAAGNQDLASGIGELYGVREQVEELRRRDQSPGA